MLPGPGGRQPQAASSGMSAAAMVVATLLVFGTVPAAAGRGLVYAVIMTCCLLHIGI